ncbi:MAG TPA: protein kinase [Terriglobales bacterium]
MGLCAGTRLGPYEIVAPLGAGGQGEVYRARDQRLDREVAIKLIPSELTHDPAGHKRMEREARTLSRLNHPNIASIYEFDSHDGTEFIVMELVSGESLRAKLTGGALPFKEVLAFGMQTAEGLAAAHDAGIVHRDLKPENLIITSDGRLKILDFGLAKPAAAASAAATVTDAFVTEAGSAVGTLPYMAPEQLRGEEVDARADIYAAGAVLYEMATGKPAFSERGVMLVAAILNRDPQPAEALNPLVTPGLSSIITKALDKDPARRYQSARELRVDLERLSTSTATRPVVQPARRPRRTAWLVPVALVVILAGGLWVGTRRGSTAASTREPIRAIAVLPLENFSGDPQQDYFADGMTEELTTTLSHIQALRVISRTSVMQYKGTHKPAPQIARELHVDALVEGSVLRSGDRVRITAKLIPAVAETTMWAKDFERDVRDVLAVQSEVARAIADEIKVQVTPQEQQRLAAAASLNPQAHEAYLRGRYELSKYTEKDLHAAIRFFEQAIALEPKFALAYAGMADGYASLSTSYEAPKTVMPQAKAAALKALELDDTLSAVHSSLAFILLYYDWDLPAVERECKQALELNANNADAHSVYAQFLAVMGRQQEMMAELQRALELDPLSGPIYFGSMWSLFESRRYQDAIALGRKALELNLENGFAHNIISVSQAQLGQFAEAMREADAAVKADDSPFILAASAGVYAQAGKKAESLRLLAQLEARRRYVCSYEVAISHVYMRDLNTAFRLLDKAFDDHSDCMPWLRDEPRLDAVRSDPRFERLLRRVGFPQP